jgi:hypothetical protein
VYGTLLPSHDPLDRRAGGCEILSASHWLMASNKAFYSQSFIATLRCWQEQRCSGPPYPVFGGVYFRLRIPMSILAEHGCTPLKTGTQYADGPA